MFVEFYYRFNRTVDPAKECALIINNEIQGPTSFLTVFNCYLYWQMLKFLLLLYDGLNDSKSIWKIMNLCVLALFHIMNSLNLQPPEKVYWQVTMFLQHRYQDLYEIIQYVQYTSSLMECK